MLKIKVICDFQELLELGEQIGNASDAGLNSNVIRSLPKICYAKPSDTSAASSHGLSDSDNMCYVCRENFETNEMLRCLPCCHRFHIKCIDTWLKVSRSMVSLSLLVVYHSILSYCVNALKRSKYHNTSVHGRF